MNTSPFFSSVTFGNNAIGVLPILDPNAITSPSNTTTPGVGATPKDGAGGIKPPEGVTGSVVPPVTGIVDAGVVKSPYVGTVKTTEILSIPLAKWDDYQKNKKMFDDIISPLTDLNNRKFNTVEEIQLAVNQALEKMIAKVKYYAGEAIKGMDLGGESLSMVKGYFTDIAYYVSNYSSNWEKFAFYFTLLIGITRAC